MAGQCVPWMRNDRKNNPETAQNDQVKNMIIGALIALAASALIYCAYKLFKAIFKK
jgi:hypothetical protein